MELDGDVAVGVTIGGHGQGGPDDGHVVAAPGQHAGREEHVGTSTGVTAAAAGPDQSDAVCAVQGSLACPSPGAELALPTAGAGELAGTKGLVCQAGLIGGDEHDDLQGTATGAVQPAVSLRRPCHRPQERSQISVTPRSPPIPNPSDALQPSTARS